jgi:hypothetical protein
MTVPRRIFELETAYAAQRDAGAEINWSISALEGASLDALAPIKGCSHPMVEAAMVRDAPADFVADPFLLEREGRLFMFFEVHNRVRNQGEIGVATSEDGRAWEYEGIVLSVPYHLSYPFVFQRDGDVFMLPEACDKEAVILYVATAFPFGWEPVCELISGAPFVDPTLVNHEGFNYLFAGEAYAGTLHLFIADDLRGQWRPHKCSPIVRSDVRHSRPAGRFVHDGDGWVRLAQSTEPIYGAYISGFRITDLSPDRYCEERLAAYPLLTGSGHGWNAFGMHHLDAIRRPGGSWYAVADGFGILGSASRSDATRQFSRP